MTKRPKTTREIETERQTQARERGVQAAKHALRRLRSHAQELEGYKKMEALAKQMHEYMGWLVAESDVYEQAAAELYAEQASPTACVANGENWDYANE